MRTSSTEPFAHAALEEAARALTAEKGIKLGELAQPARLALTGVLASPPLFEMIEVLGTETTRRRLLAFADRIADRVKEPGASAPAVPLKLSLIHISEPTRLGMISY